MHRTLGSDQHIAAGGNVRKLKLPPVIGVNGGCLGLILRMKEREPKPFDPSHLPLSRDRRKDSLPFNPVERIRFCAPRRLYKGDRIAWILRLLRGGAPLPEGKEKSQKEEHSDAYLHKSSA
jgi:hypothetical protein